MSEIKFVVSPSSSTLSQSQSALAGRRGPLRPGGSARRGAAADPSPPGWMTIGMLAMMAAVWHNSRNLALVAEPLSLCCLSARCHGGGASTSVTATAACCHHTTTGVWV